MSKLDPIIAVENVAESALWYHSVFNCKNAHGGDEFAVLQSQDGEVLVCLHRWGDHEHPTMIRSEITPGNGLILYYRTDIMSQIRQNLKEIDYPIEEDIHLNANSRQRQFSVRDPDGYFWIVTEFHRY